MRWVLAVPLALLAACEPQFGPCIHTYEDPVIRIKDVRDTTASQPVYAPLLITNVRVAGFVQTRDLLLGKSERVEMRGDTLVCAIPCGFGTQEGAYRFAVEVPGYYRDSVSLDARYRDHRSLNGGCPSSSFGPTEVTVRLAKRPADSARVAFRFITERVASTLTSAALHAEWDDGSGWRRVTGPSYDAWYPTRPTGQLRVRLSLIDGDTIGRGDLVLDLRPDWTWGATAYVARTNPIQQCFGCFGSKAYPLRRTPNVQVDSFYVLWGGNWISKPVVY